MSSSSISISDFSIYLITYDFFVLWFCLNFCWLWNTIRRDKRQSTLNLRTLPMCTKWHSVNILKWTRSSIVLWELQFVKLLTFFPWNILIFDLFVEFIFNISAATYNSNSFKNSTNFTNFTSFTNFKATFLNTERNPLVSLIKIIFEIL